MKRVIFLIILSISSLFLSTNVYAQLSVEQQETKSDKILWKSGYNCAKYTIDKIYLLYLVRVHINVINIELFDDDPMIIKLGENKEQALKTIDDLKDLLRLKIAKTDIVSLDKKFSIKYDNNNLIITEASKKGQCKLSMRNLEKIQEAIINN